MHRAGVVALLLGLGFANGALSKTSVDSPPLVYNAFVKGGPVIIGRIEEFAGVRQGNLTLCVSEQLRGASLPAD